MHSVDEKRRYFELDLWCASPEDSSEYHNTSMDTLRLEVLWHGECGFDVCSSLGIVYYTPALLARVQGQSYDQAFRWLLQPRANNANPPR
jgi:hypothetical protein